MTGISITPLGETIGAHVEGLDLSSPLSPEARVAVLQAIGKHKVHWRSQPSAHLPVYLGHCRNMS